MEYRLQIKEKEIECWWNQSFGGRAISIEDFHEALLSFKINIKIYPHLSWRLVDELNYIYRQYEGEPVSQIQWSKEGF